MKPSFIRYPFISFCVTTIISIQYTLQVTNLPYVSFFFQTIWFVAWSCFEREIWQCRKRLPNETKKSRVMGRTPRWISKTLWVTRVWRHSNERISHILIVPLSSIEQANGCSYSLRNSATGYLCPDNFPQSGSETKLSMFQTKISYSLPDERTRCPKSS